MNTTPTAHARLDAWIDAHFDDEVRFLQALVQVPTDTPPGNNAPHAERTAALLAGFAFEAEKHPVPAQQVKDYGLESITNLIVRRRYAGDGNGPTIALNAHGDVVPPGEGWTKPPYEGVVENGRMVGRGVAVSKSDIASYTYAVLALKAAARDGARLDGTVELHFTYDEEFGGLAGPGWLLEHGLTKPDLAIAASFSYAIVTAHNGCLQLEVTVHGKATHGAIPKTGHDALRAANAILTAVYAEADRLESVRSKVTGIESPTFIVGTVAGGINTNVVPDRIVLKMDRRMIPEEDPATVEARVREVIEGAVRGRPGIRVDVRRLLLARALKPLPGHEKLVAVLQKHGRRVFGEPIPAVGVPLYADARLYGERGIPIVMYGAGPRTILEANAKRADETLVLEDLRRATQVVASAVADLLST